MEDKRTNAQVLEQIRVEASAKNEQEEAQKNEIFKQETKKLLSRPTHYRGYAIRTDPRRDRKENA